MIAEKTKKPMTIEIFPHLETLQGEHLLVEVFSATRFDKILKKTSTTTSSIERGGFSKCFI
jgi:hypothetical protein